MENSVLTMTLSAPYILVYVYVMFRIFGRHDDHRNTQYNTVDRYCTDIHYCRPVPSPTLTRGRARNYGVGEKKTHSGVKKGVGVVVPFTNRHDSRLTVFSNNQHIQTERWSSEELPFIMYMATYFYRN